MRKKSHISLAMYIADSLGEDVLSRHRKAFCIGSILPDCKFSFLTTKHEFTGTISMVKNKIREMTTDYDPASQSERKYVIDLGQVLHYIADYFTFPHNATYDGNLKDHCAYEKELKFSLRSYIRSGEAHRVSANSFECPNCDALFSFLEKAHQEYLSMKRNVEEDCIYIVRICHQVAEAILSLLNIQKAKAYAFSYPQYSTRVPQF